jgi:hypothetical protein
MHTLAFTDDDRVEDMKQVILDRGSRLIECTGAFGQYDMSETMQIGGHLGATVTYGSCNFMKFVTSSASWVPGHWCDWKLLECTSYMQKLNPRSIHHNYAYLTFGELGEKYNQMYDAFHEKHCVFIRPNSNAKPFHGQCVHYANFKEWYDTHVNGWKIIPDMMCMISQPTEIDAEWRLFVHNGKVISGSMYRPDWTADYDPFINEYVEESLRTLDFSPFPLFSVDVALTKHGVHAIIEYGSINCAGLYSARVEPIVEAVESEAIKEYEDYYGNHGNLQGSHS